MRIAPEPVTAFDRLQPLNDPAQGFGRSSQEKEKEKTTWTILRNTALAIKKLCLWYQFGRCGMSPGAKGDSLSVTFTVVNGQG